MFDSDPFGVMGQLLLGVKVGPIRFQLAGSPGVCDSAAFCPHPAEGPAHAV